MTVKVHTMKVARTFGVTLTQEELNAVIDALARSHNAYDDVLADDLAHGMNAHMEER